MKYNIISYSSFYSTYSTHFIQFILKCLYLASYCSVKFKPDIKTPMAAETSPCSCTLTVP